MNIDYSNDEMFEMLKENNEEISKNIPSKIIESNIDSKSRIPFKVRTLENILTRRALDLIESLIILHENKRYLAEIIIVRSLSETISLLYWMLYKVNKIFETKDFGDFDTFLMKNIFGSKTIETEKEPLEPYNVLTAIDKMDSIISGFRKNYDILCEFAHPNYFGSMGMYSKLDSNEGILTLKSLPDSFHVKTSLSTAVALIKFFQKLRNDLDTKFEEFCELCDSEYS